MKRSRMLIVVFIIAAALLLLVIGLRVTAKADYQFEEESPYIEPTGPVWTHAMELAHVQADIYRAMGYSEDSYEIQECKRIWNQSKEDLDIIARTVEGEAGCCTWSHKVAVAAVVRNRVEHERFPNTVRDVISQPGQYGLCYLKGFELSQPQSYAAAKLVLDGEDHVPHDVIWQAQFPQGKETWWISETRTPWFQSTTWFCKGVY